MTVHQCPKCELKFSWTTELDDHCRNDHPSFHHEYPVGGVPHDYDAAVVLPLPPPPEAEPEPKVEHPVRWSF